jgi:hypothetical protein
MAITKMTIPNSGVNYFTFRSYLLFFERRLDGVDDPPRREERGHRTVPDRDRSRQPWSISGSAPLSLLPTVFLTDLRIASATLDLGCSGGVSEH